jgi:hypothetical protein
VLKLEHELNTFNDYGVSLIPRDGRAIAQAVSLWLPAAVAQVRARVWSTRICGRQSVVGAGFLRVLRFPLKILIAPNSPSSQSPGAGKIGQLVADVPSGPSLDPTPHYENLKENVYPEITLAYNIFISVPHSQICTFMTRTCVL